MSLRAVDAGTIRAVRNEAVPDPRDLAPKYHTPTIGGMHAPAPDRDDADAASSMPGSGEVPIERSTSSVAAVIEDRARDLSALSRRRARGWDRSLTLAERMRLRDVSTGETPMHRPTPTPTPIPRPWHDTGSRAQPMAARPRSISSASFGVAAPRTSRSWRGLQALLAILITALPFCTAYVFVSMRLAAHNRRLQAAAAATAASVPAPVATGAARGATDATPVRKAIDSHRKLGAAPVLAPRAATPNARDAPPPSAADAPPLPMASPAPAFDEMVVSDLFVQGATSIAELRSAIDRLLPRLVDCYLELPPTRLRPPAARFELLIDAQGRVRSALVQTRVGKLDRCLAHAASRYLDARPNGSALHVWWVYRSAPEPTRFTSAIGD